MKKWADLKCDGKRRIIAMRGPNGKNVRKKRLGPVEQMVHKILMMSPNGGERMSDTPSGTREGPGVQRLCVDVSRCQTVRATQRSCKKKT